MSQTLHQLAEASDVSRILFQGSPQAAAVRVLQTTLYELGYGALLQWERFGADGIYGRATQKAIQALAQQAGVPSDGSHVSEDLLHHLIIRYQIAGPLRIVHRLAPPEVHLRRGQKGGEVEALQWLLHYQGLEHELQWARFGADGAYGGATAAAVSTFAQRQGLARDGNQVDAELRDRLVAATAPDLGPDWASVSMAQVDPDPGRRPSGSSQYQKRAERLHDDVVRRFQGTLKFERLAVPIEQDGIDLEFYQVSRLDGDGGYHFDQRVLKKKVALHFTAGQVYGDLATLTNPEGSAISTAFVIGYDGAIYRLFSHLEYWAWHLGRNALGSNSQMSPTSIGIEVSNWGPLREENGQLLTWSHEHYFCDLNDTEAYYRLDQPYRGAQYFARPTDEQYKSLILLLRYLTEPKADLESEGAFTPVQRAFLPPEKRAALFDSHDAARAFAGICCHTNFQPHGKWDFPPEPGFAWERIVQGVTEPLPAEWQVRTRSLLGPERVTEDEILRRTAHLRHAQPHPDTIAADGPEEGL